MAVTWSVFCRGCGSPPAVRTRRLRKHAGTSLSRSFANIRNTGFGSINIGATSLRGWKANIHSTLIARHSSIWKSKVRKIRRKPKRSASKYANTHDGKESENEALRYHTFPPTLRLIARSLRQFPREEFYSFAFFYDEVK